MTLIEGLLSSARQRGHAKFIAELTTLRAVAELQAQAQGMAPGPTNGAPTRQPDVVSTMMEFTQRIMPSVEMAARQGSNPVLTAQLIAELFNGKLPEREPCLEVPEMLSVREFQVLQLVAQGHSNQQVGHQLCISEGTVKKHLSNLLDKLNAGNRTQAVARARAIGIL